MGGGSGYQVGSKEYGESVSNQIKGIWWVGGGSSCQVLYHGGTRTLYGRLPYNLEMIQSGSGGWVGPVIELSTLYKVLP